MSIKVNSGVEYVSYGKPYIPEKQFVFIKYEGTCPHFGSCKIKGMFNPLTAHIQIYCEDCKEVLYEEGVT